MGRRIYLYVTPFFPSQNSWRGSYCFDFVRALQRELGLRVGVGEWKVLVFMPGAGEDYEIGGVKVYRFPTKQLPSNVLPFLFARYNARSFLNKVKDVLNSEQVAVCHAHTANLAIYALAAKRKFGCQALLHHHDLQSFGLNLGVLRHCALYNAVLFRQLRELFEQIDTHVFISEKCRESFLKAPDASWTIYDDYKRQMRGPALFHCRPVHIKNSIILHNGVDTTIFHPLSRPRPQTSTSFTIGCIGNFIDLKDQATLIKAVALLKKPVKVIFVGSGPTLQHCKEVANSIVDLHLQPTPIFEFRTEVPHEQLADFYRSLDLFVLPSYFEGFGCVLAEANACGVPFVACRNQGVDDLLSKEDQNYWLFNCRDANDLSQRICRAMVDRYSQNLSCDSDIRFVVHEYLEKLLCLMII